MAVGVGARLQSLPSYRTAHASQSCTCRLSGELLRRTSLPDHLLHSGPALKRLQQHAALFIRDGRQRVAISTVITVTFRYLALMREPLNILRTRAHEAFRGTMDSEGRGNGRSNARYRYSAASHVQRALILKG